MSQEYPAFPEGSSHADQEAYHASREQPPSIKTAVMLMRVGAAVSVISILVGLVTLGALKDEVRQQLEDAGTSFSESDVDTLYGVSVGIIIVSGLIGVALWLWMASANGKGKRWARVVATVLGVINALSFLFAVTAGSQTLLSSLVGAASLIVGVSALVFMYRRDASAFYAANSRR